MFAWYLRMRPVQAAMTARHRDPAIPSSLPNPCILSCKCVRGSLVLVSSWGVTGSSGNSPALDCRLQTLETAPVDELWGQTIPGTPYDVYREHHRAQVANAQLRVQHWSPLRHASSNHRQQLQLSRSSNHRPHSDSPPTALSTRRFSSPLLATGDAQRCGRFFSFINARESSHAPASARPPGAAYM
jgi:hypothetical protein